MCVGCVVGWLGRVAGPVEGGGFRFEWGGWCGAVESGREGGREDQGPVAF